MSVIAALELHDTVASRVAARQANRAHGRFSARAHHPDELYGRHQLADLLGDARLDLRRCAERKTQRRALLHRADHVGVGVTENHRAPGSDIVDVALAVVPEHVWSRCALDEDGLDRKSTRLNSSHVKNS